MSSVLGWDIGGVNTKAALVVDGVVQRVLTRQFELQRSPEALTTLLENMARTLSGDDAPDAYALTMTAELSQMFRTKREGVHFVLEAVERGFSGAVHVYTTEGTFVTPDVARMQPLAVAAANWVATTNVVATHYPDALLVDIGTTTTDLIPIVGGHVAARGRTDPDRLRSGELVYSGAVRTPVEAIVSEVPLGDGTARVSAEAFALSGDVYVWLGDLQAGDYDAPTPDRRPSTRPFAGERLARVVCADREILDDEAITAMAIAIAQTQANTIARSMGEVLQAHPSITTAVVTGLGAFIGARAAKAAGLDVIPLSGRFGLEGARSAPATAVALLLHECLESRHTRDCQARQRTPDTVRGTTARPAPVGIIVVKLGGSLLANPSQWRVAISALTAAVPAHRLVVVPGGGPFADAVRSIDERFRLPDDTTHWMAIAGMDQHAEMIATSGAPFVKVTDTAGVTAAHDRHCVPVLAPLRWLRATDPLPHSWDITSDSIAAWIAGQINAARLVVVKSAGAGGPAMFDPGFLGMLPRDLPWAVCDAFGLEAQFADVAPSPR